MIMHSTNAGAGGVSFPVMTTFSVCASLLSLLLLPLLPTICSAQEDFFAGDFITMSHLTSGQLYVLSDRVLEIRNFLYDGQGPAAYFWIDTSSTPSPDGRVAADGFPANGCATTVENAVRLPAASGTTQRVELPEGTTISDFLGGSLSVWCERFNVNFGHVVIPESIMIPNNDPPPALECFQKEEEEEMSGGGSMTTTPGYFAGDFITMSHLTAGQLYVLSERVLEIRNFMYDGQGPAAYFWIDTVTPPSADGQVAADGFPANGCATTVENAIRLPAADGTTQRVELPEGTTINDFLGGSLSVWCERFRVNFGHVNLPESVTIPNNEPGPALECFQEEEGTGMTPDMELPPSIATTPDGFNCEPLNDVFQVRWQIDGDNLNVELLGDIEDGTYMGFGISGRPDTETFMVGADAVVADMTESGPRVQDIFLDSRAQCNGSSGVCPDMEGGYANDVSGISAEQDAGLTLIRYTRPLVPTENGVLTTRGEPVDRSIPATTGIDTYVIWALGPMSSVGNPLFHNIDFARKDGNNVSLDFGRTPIDNCPPLETTDATDPPAEPFNRPVLGVPDGTTTFICHIGPSGGPRGYETITGTESWGIAWYINGYLIPKLVLRRGTTYTFVVSGGNDPTDDPNYHPFYLTEAPDGGYLQKLPSERLEETPLAGVLIIDSDSAGVYDFEAAVVAPICSYQTTSDTAAAFLGTYQEYFDTLDSSCASDDAIVSQAAMLTFTPDASTPDKIYYHCVSHRDLGFEIEVVDAEATPVESPTETPAPVESDNFGGGDFENMELTGQLAGATLNYRVNIGDPDAWGQDTLTVVLEVPVVGWVGFAFNDGSGGMVGSEAVIGLPDTGEVQKYNLNQRSVSGVQPMDVTRQTLIGASITQTLDSTTLTFTKILIEEGEIPINKNDVNTFLSAWGDDNVLGRHEAREAFEVTLTPGDSAPSPAPVDGGGETPTTPSPVETSAPVEVPNEEAETPAPLQVPGEEAGFQTMTLTGQLEGATLSYKVNTGANEAVAGERRTLIVEDTLAEDTITVILEVPAIAWVGFAISDNGGFMVGSEAIIGLPDTGEVKKYNLNAQGTAGVLPMSDEKQTLIDASITQTSDSTTLKFTKILIEEGEIPIQTDAANTFLSAWGSSNSLDFHAKREPYEVTVLGPGVTPAPALPTPAPVEMPTPIDVSVGFESVALTGQLEGATLHFRVNDQDPAALGEGTMTVVLETPATGWVGFGFNNNGGMMVGSEAVIGLPDTGVVEKYVLNAKETFGVVPMPDERQTLIDASITQNAGGTTLTFTRRLYEEDEIPIDMNGVNTFLSAWGSSNILGVHEAREPYDVMIISSGPEETPGQEAGEGFEAMSLTGQLEGATLKYRINEGDLAAAGQDTITLILEAPAEGWVGLAINGGDNAMIGSEAIIGLPDTGEVQKYDLNDQVTSAVVPMAAERQTLIDASITQSEGSTTLQFTKILVEVGEIPIEKDTVNTFLSAWGSSNVLGFHAAREPYQVTLLTPDSTVAVQPVVSPSDSSPLAPTDDASGGCARGISLAVCLASVLVGSIFLV